MIVVSFLSVQSFLIRFYLSNFSVRLLADPICKSTPSA